MFGPVTDAERRGWQIRALMALSSLLRSEPRLPPVTFTVPPGLRAHAVLTPYDGDQTHLRAILTAYADALDTSVVEQRWPVEPPQEPGARIGRLLVTGHHAGIEITLHAPHHAPDTHTDNDDAAEGH